MKRIRLMATVAALTGLMASGALAQDAQSKSGLPSTSTGAPGAGAAIREQLQKAQDDLKLTDEQKTKMQEAQREQAEKMRALMQDLSIPREEKIEKMKELRASQETKLKSILTPEQFEKWTKMRSEMQGQLRQRAAAAGKAATDKSPVQPKAVEQSTKEAK